MLRKHEGQRGSIPGMFSAVVDSADSPETMVEVCLQQYLVLKSWPLLLGAGMLNSFSQFLQASV